MVWSWTLFACLCFTLCLQLLGMRWSFLCMWNRSTGLCYTMNLVVGTIRLPHSYFLIIKSVGFFFCLFHQLVLEVVQPDMTQYLKMTPAERGLLLPSYMKAERLCNGAVKYTRTTDPLKNNTFHLTDNFSSPSGRCRLPAIETKMQLTTYVRHEY